MIGTVLRLRGVDVGYGKAPVVHDVGLELRAGELLVVLGENGSGKSTLVKGILGLAPVTAGSVELFGAPASPATRQRVGYVPQRTTVAGGIPTTVSEVVASGRVARRRWLSRLRDTDREAVRSALDAVRLGDRARDPLAELSGGQQRRALIARALAGEPDLLVMDEPTAGVDAVNVELLAETVAALKSKGTTVVVVAHGTGPLAPHVDRAVVLSSGRVSFSGPLPTMGSPADAPTDDHEHGDEPTGEARRLAAPEEPRWT